MTASVNKVWYSSFLDSRGAEATGLFKLFSALPEHMPSNWCDVRADDAWREKGIDFLLPGGLTLDFKVEAQKGNNCAAELITSDRPTLRPGWLLESKANWIVHAFMVTGELVCLPTQAYRDLALAHCYANRTSTAARNPSRGELRYLTWNALVPCIEAIRLPGAFWCQLPGYAHLDKEEFGRISKQTEEPAVPIEWFVQWLQCGAPKKPSSFDCGTDVLNDIYAAIYPQNIKKMRDQEFYIAWPPEN